MRQPHQLVDGQRERFVGVLDQIIVHEGRLIGRDTDHRLVELHLDQPPFSSELDDVALDLDYSPELLYELAKMDGAIVLSSNATKIAQVNVQLTPDPTILTFETGTRHRTAERVSKQTDAIVVAVSERREVVSLYVDGMKYILEDIPVVLAKANQALATLDKYRSRLDQVSTRLTALEFEGGATLHDVLTVLQRAELVTRMAVEIELDPAGEQERQLVGIADHDQAAGVRVEDVVHPLAQRSPRRHHLQCSDDPGVLSRFELFFELLTGPLGHEGRFYLVLVRRAGRVRS